MNIFRFYSAITMILLLACWASGQQNGFRGIIPLITTRGEVEKKLGKPDKFGRYELDEGRIEIHYRENECSKSNLN